MHTGTYMYVTINSEHIQSYMYMYNDDDACS